MTDSELDILMDKLGRCRSFLPPEILSRTNMGLGAVLCRGYCGMDTDKRRRWRRTVALLIILERDGLLLGIRIRLRLDGRRLAVWSHSIHLIPFSGLDVLPCNIVQLLIIPLYRL